MSTHVLNSYPFCIAALPLKEITQQPMYCSLEMRLYKSRFALAVRKCAINAETNFINTFTLHLTDFSSWCLKPYVIARGSVPLRHTQLEYRCHQMLLSLKINTKKITFKDFSLLNYRTRVRSLLAMLVSN